MDGITARAKAFDGKWYPAQIVGARVFFVGGPVSVNVPVEIECAPNDKERAERLVERLAAAGWKNVALCVAPPLSKGA